MRLHVSFGLGLLTALSVGACDCGDNPFASPTDGSMPSDAADGSTDLDGAIGPDGSPGDSGFNKTIAALRIEPPMATLTTDGVTPAEQQFKVFAILTDASQEDVSNIATLSLSDASLGRLDGAKFVSGFAGGNTALQAELNGHTTNAPIEIRLDRTVIIAPPGGGTPIPTDVGDLFNNAPDDPNRAPDLVYPNDRVLLPPNLNAVEIHYRPGGGNNTLFELSFTGPLSSVTVYTRCVGLGPGCLFAPDASLWSQLAETHRGKGPLSVRIRATDDTGTGVGSSNQIEIEFSAVPVQGGLYYWTTSARAIMRVDFNAQNPVPEQFFPFQGEGGCYGCHALSPNGRRMTLSRDGQNQAPLTLIDVTGPSTTFRDQGDRREQFQSWNPTSDKFAAIYGDNNAPGDYARTAIRIRDGNTGDVLDTIEVNDEPTHPDWSPRGDRILFTRSTMPNTTNQRPGRCGLSYVQQQANGSWGGPTALIEPEDGFNRYYPAFSPDGQFLVYNESICAQGETYNGDCDGDADDVAKLWALDADATRAPIELERANQPGIEDNGNTDLANTFPKWAPFVDPRMRDGSGRVMWMTFSSRREYGLRSPDGSNQWIWMVAIDPDRVLTGEDGSHAAFAVPFQDLGTSNHIAQWAAQIVPPTTGGDGGVPDGNTGGDGGIDPGGSDGGGADGGIDPGGMCLQAGDPCDPANSKCCTGLVCGDQGGGVFRCRFDF